MADTMRRFCGLLGAIAVLLMGCSCSGGVGQQNTQPTPSATPLAITTLPSALKTGTVGASYPALTFAATGGAPPYTWRVANGNIPPGITLTGAGALSGTPTAAGTYTFTVQVTDSKNTAATLNLTINISPPPPTVAVSVTPPSITQSQSAILAWSSIGADSCSAAGAWSGSQATSGSQTVQPTALGPNTYTLTCVSASGNTTASAVLTVNPPAPSSAWSWQQVSTVSIPCTGSLLSNGVLDLPDGSRLFVFSGPNGSPNPTPFEAVQISTAATLQDMTTTVFPSNASGAVHARRMVVGDLNGDGIPDFFSANHGYDQPPFPGEKNTLYLSTGAGYTDASASLPQINMFTHSATAADTRKVGALDILVGGLGMTENAGLPAMYQGPNTAGTNNDYVGPYILRGDNGGHFTYDNISLPAKVANNWLADSSAPGRFTSSLFVDVDGDGYPDLVLGSDQNSDAAGSVYLNDGHGRFVTTELVLPPGVFGKQNTITVDIETVDLNYDGKPDLILSQVPNAPVFYGGGKLQVLINRGGGSFSDQTSTYLPSGNGNGAWTEFVNFTDFEGSACNSIVEQISYPQSGDIQVFTCDGKGAYAALPSSQLPTSPAFLTPVTISGKVYLLTATANGTKAVVSLFERK
jgi:putative Ig domain-containing protein/VCBS repeat protein